MKNIFILALLPEVVFAQQNEIEIPLESKKTEIEYVHHIAGKGLMFHNEEEDYRDYNLISQPQLILLNENLKLLAQAKIKRTDKDGPGHFLSSTNSEAAYYVSFCDGFKKFKATKIGWDGSTQEIVIDDFDKKVKLSNFDITPEAIFIDSDKLLLTQRYKNGKKSVTYFCVIDLKTLDVKDKLLELPEVNINNNAGVFGWRYMGHGNGIIHFKCMEEPEDKKQSAIPTRFAQVDYEGKVVSSCVFNLDISPQFTFLSRNIQPYNNVELHYNNIVEDDGPLDMGSMKLSRDLKFVYLYGFVRERQGVAAKRSGFFISKYSINGEKIWQVIYPIPEEAAKDKKILIHASRETLVYYFDDNETNNKLNFHFWGESDYTYHCIVDAGNGTLDKSLKTEDYNSSGANNSVKSELVFIDKVDYNKDAYEFCKKTHPRVKRVGSNYYLYMKNNKKGTLNVWKF